MTMSAPSFETALWDRVQGTLDACTRCGKCVSACPTTGPAGISAEDPQGVIVGIVDILRTGNGPQASRVWASTCTRTGECIRSCPEGLNPRFLLAMARVAMTGSSQTPAQRRRQGIESYRRLGHDVDLLSRLQLSDELLERLGQAPKMRASPGPSPDEGLPDFVFYTGCNLLKTPHIALLCLDIMDAIGVSYRVLGGPNHCCGILQLRAGDTEMVGRLAAHTAERLSHSKTGQVLSWCPSCHVQFTEVTLPTLKRADGSVPFEMHPFMLFLASRLDQLRPLLRPLNLRIALHRHPGVAGVVEAVQAILGAIPGVTLVDLGQPAIGLMSNALAALPQYQRELQHAEFEAARDAGIDALVAVYHADHRELCAHERDWPFRIVNVLEVVGASMGLHHNDRFKQLKIMQDADAIVAECGDLLRRHSLDPRAAREVVARAMLAEQVLPLKNDAKPQH